MTSLLLAVALAASLPEVRQRLADERAAAKKLAGKEQSVLGRLADLERQIELESRGLRAAQARLRAASQRLSGAEERWAKAHAELTAANAVIEPRLVARYRLGREGYVRFLLGATSIPDLVRRDRLFNTLLRSDLEALSALQLQASTAKAARDELLAARAEQDQSVRAESERRTSLEESVEEQRKLLASVQRERGVHDQTVRELEEAERRLSQKMDEIRAAPERPATPAFRVRKSVRKARGRLPFPVDQGKIEVRFGRSVDPRFGTVTLQTGIDVRAAAGTPVRAVWDGRVAHAGWFKGFGNLLIVDHGEGVYSLMAHLDLLQKALGDSVRAGEQVATVGETGSLKGPYLYFELRDGQRPVDPEPWLSRKRRGPALIAGKGSAK